MRFSWAKLAFAVVLSTAVVAPITVAMAQGAPATASKQDNTVQVDNLTLKDADLLTATRMLTQRTGIQFVMEPTTVPFGKITLQISNVSPEDAVRYICAAAGASYKRDEYGVYMIGHAEKMPVVPVSAPLPSKAPKIVRAIKVLKAGARDVFDAIVYRMPFDASRGFDELKRFADITNDTKERIFGPGFAYANFASTHQIQPIANPATSTPLTGVESGGQIALPGDSAGQIGGGGAGGFGAGGGAGQGNGRGAGGQGGGGQLTGGVGLVPESIDFISYDPTDNSLVVRGTEEDINTLQTYVNLFDVAPRQVLVKVEYITTSETLDKSLGYEFLFNRGTVFAGTRPGAFIRQSDPVFVNYTTGNVAARMRAFLSEGSGKVVTAPIVRTLNNTPVVLQSSLQTYIFINQTTTLNNTTVSTSAPIPITAETRLGVQPRINDDNTITMYLAPTIANFVGTSTGPNGESFPNLARQSMQVVVRVKNGETIVLGGLTTKSEDEAHNRVPVLADLPIVGQFFRSSRKSRTNGELLIFVTPTIVDDEPGTTSNP